MVNGHVGRKYICLVVHYSNSLGLRIWEKKFGKHANHIKQRRQKETGRGSKPRLPESVRIDRRSGKGNSSSRPPNRTPTHSRASTHAHEHVRRPTLGGSEGVLHSGSTKGLQGQRPLHPSWEAKRKQQAASIVPPQGTKIVFSES